MIKGKIILRNQAGLHTRPATVLVKTAGNFQANIELIYNEKRIKAKKIMALLAAGIKGGAEVELVCDGEDE